MKRLLLITTIIVFAMSSCGGGSTSITGPILSLGEIKALVLDQLFINAAMEDEYRDHGEFSVYIRDAATGLDVACVRQEDGMSALTAPGIYYAGLSIGFREVDGEHPGSVARFKLIFVEKDGVACPAPIGSEDDIAGESAELTYDQLMGDRIWATNGQASAMLRASSEDELSVGSMAPSLVDGLAIDKLYFKEGDGDDNRYYIFAERMENGDSVYQCQIDDQYMEKVRTYDVLYAALGFPISCFDPADLDFVNTEVRIGLYVQTDSGPKLIGQTDPAPIGDLVGERADFTNGKGFVTFRRVSTGFFGSTVVRLADLRSMEVTLLEFLVEPTTDSPLEIFASDVDSGVVLACAGAAQGLTGIAAAGSYGGLTVDLVTMSGGMELFGSNEVVISLVERIDGDECPDLPSGEISILAETEALVPADLDEGTAPFTGGGRIDFVQASN